MSITNDEHSLITVIVPVYNSPDLYMCLDSVLIQTYSRIQIIVLDDCSDDFNSNEVDDYLRDRSRSNLEEIIVIQNATNIGTVKNMNQGFRLSKGKYIFSLAGDDAFYDERVLEDWVEEFEKSGASIITAKRACCDTSLKESGIIEPSKDKIELITTLSPHELFAKMCEANFIIGCCTARSKAFIDKVGFYDESYRLIDDYPMNLQYLRQGYSFHFYDRTVIKYRGGGASSPLKYNRIYESDSNRILKKEILPYTRDHKLSKRYLKEWKRMQLRGKYEYIKHNPYKRVIYKIYYLLKYPNEVGDYIKRHFGGWINCGML